MSTTFGCLDFSRIAICTAAASQAPHDQHQGCHLRSRQVDQAAAWRTTFTPGNRMPTERPTRSPTSCILRPRARMARAPSPVTGCAALCACPPTSFMSAPTSFCPRLPGSSILTATGSTSSKRARKTVPNAPARQPKALRRPADTQAALGAHKHCKHANEAAKPAWPEGSASAACALDRRHAGLLGCMG